MNFERNYRFFFDLFMEGEVSPFYHNTIRNTLTDKVIFKGEDHSIDYKGLKLSTVWDVPEYLHVALKKTEPGFKLKKIRQYKGYLIDLTAFEKPDNYLTTQLSSRNRKKLRSKKNKLESTSTIRYIFYYGHIEKEEYDLLFSHLNLFLENRFQEKKAVNHNRRKWGHYHKLVYPLILKKRASLFVVYDSDKPVSIALQFHLADTVFSFIQSYDITYSEYNMGDINMIKRLEWCFANGFKILDLSMGETDYKIKWCNHQYDLYFHLFYNSNSMTTILKGYMALGKLKFKQYLRDKNILGKLFRYDKFKYRIRHLVSKAK